MKAIKLTLAIAAIMLLALSCNHNHAPRVLVLYYSQGGTTKAVAEELQSKLGADIEAIVPLVPYDGDYQSTIERGRKELDEKILPELQPLTSDLNSYDVIFLGYPVWFGTYAQPVATLLADNDFSGKKIVPFCTFGSGGLDSSSKHIAEQLPDAQILPSYGIRAARLDAAATEIERFLIRGGFIKGECPAEEDFSARRPVSDEESAIFDAAIGNYPMIRAKAASVASRNTPDGTEYLFTATSSSRDGRPAGEIKVHVLAAEGQEPVFTQVKR